MGWVHTMGMMMIVLFVIARAHCSHPEGGPDGGRPCILRIDSAESSVRRAFFRAILH